MLLHLLSTFLPRQRAILSNLFQLLFPLATAAVSLHQRRFSTNSIGRRCWSALASAFGIWSAAQAIYIYLLYFPFSTSHRVRPDDALWVLFGLPLLLAVNTTHDELDRVRWLDRAQAVLFFAVLYLLAFLPSARLDLNTMFLIQNLALALCCLLRLPICVLGRERRFFGRLFVFLIIYGPSERLGEFMYAHGWEVGSAADLVWTFPPALLILLILRDASLPLEEKDAPSRLQRAVGSMQGLSIASMAFVSIAMAAFLATWHPVLGGVFVALAFIIFGLRINGRERAWHEAHEKLQQTVLQDALTGLGNRILLRNSLMQVLSHPEPDSSPILLFADLDRFKAINDSLGHALGDRLLIEIAGRLRSAAPDRSVVCRLGGDEFVVLTQGKTDAEAKACGVALLNALRLPVELGDHILRCTASVGVVLAGKGQAADDLLRTADHAMYRAKQLGKNRVQCFDSSMLQQMSRKWQMEADLRDCVERNQIDVAFQPLLNVRSGEITGFEALARWSHPRHGQVAPCDFITLAEDAGLIHTLGRQVLEKACRQVATWNRSWNKRFTVSVNVSPRQFSDDGLMSMVLDTLEKAGLGAHLLRLEVTESALLVHEEFVKQVLAEARAHGIRISLDDFGTGYSSLSFLLNLPVDEVKVDRSFVSGMQTDLQRREVVRTVVQLGQSLGKSVVVEGIESEQDLCMLMAMGCEFAQGWLISRPLLADAMETDLPQIVARSLRTVQAAHAGKYQHLAAAAELARRHASLGGEKSTFEPVPMLMSTLT